MEEFMPENENNKKDEKPGKTPPPSNGKPVSQMRPATESTSFSRNDKSTLPFSKEKPVNEQTKPKPTPIPSKGINKTAGKK